MSDKTKVIKSSATDINERILSKNKVSLVLAEPYFSYGISFKFKKNYYKLICLGNLYHCGIHSII